MSSESYPTKCPVCGFDFASDARDGHIDYIWCPLCSYHENETENAYGYAWGTCEEEAKKSIKRKDYNNNDEYDEAIEEKTNDLVIAWIESEVGKNFRPNDEAILEYKKIAQMINIFASSLSEDCDWYDIIDLNDYDAYLEEINNGKTASWFFGMLKRETIKNMLDGIFEWN